MPLPILLGQVSSQDHEGEVASGVQGWLQHLLERCGQGGTAASSEAGDQARAGGGGVPLPTPVTDLARNLGGAPGMDLQLVILTGSRLEVSPSIISRCLVPALLCNPPCARTNPAGSLAPGLESHRMQRHFSESERWVSGKNVAPAMGDRLQSHDPSQPGPYTCASPNRELRPLRSPTELKTPSSGCRFPFAESTTVPAVQGRRQGRPPSEHAPTAKSLC